MSNENKKLFKEAGEAALKKAAARDRSKPQERKPSRLDQRVATLMDLGREEALHKTLRRVDPARCRMWTHHNRRYGLMNETRCRDLIEGIKAQNGQEFPAVVRRISGDLDHDYEVICGARRHWTVQYLREQHYDFLFLIEVRDLSDEEAFRLSDIENRDRQDISDFERAVDYKHALSAYYDSNQGRMAQRLDVSQSWLSRYLKLTELPEAVIAAYADVTHIKEIHARTLLPLIEEKREGRSYRAKVLAKAAELSALQSAAREEGRPGPDGAEVLRQLVAVKRQAKPRTVSHSYNARNGAVMLEAKANARSGLTLRVTPGSGADAAEILKACEEALRAYLDWDFANWQNFRKPLN